MTVILLITCVIWLIGFMLSVQAVSNDPDIGTAVPRTAILIACAFWPVALAVAFVRIIIGAKG